MQHDNPTLRSNILNTCKTDVQSLSGARHFLLVPYSIAARRAGIDKCDVLVLPEWCQLEDVNAKFPPEHHGARLENFIIHVAPPVGIYQKGTYRLHVHMRDQTAMPHMVWLTHIWHPNIDLNGKINAKLLMKFAKETKMDISADREDDIDFYDGPTLSVFLLQCLALLLDDGNSWAARSEGIQHLQRQQEMLARDGHEMARLAALEQKLWQLKTSHGCFFVEKSVTKWAMNQVAGEQLRHPCKCQRKSCICKGKSSAHFDREAEKWAYDYAHPVLVEPHKCVRWIKEPRPYK